MMLSYTDSPDYRQTHQAHVACRVTRYADRGATIAPRLAPLYRCDVIVCLCVWPTYLKVPTYPLSALGLDIDSLSFARSNHGSLVIEETDMNGDGCKYARTRIGHIDAEVCCL